MISVIVPVYKQNKLLDKFLESLTKQTCKKFEVILAIDTNSDDVLDVVEKHWELRKNATIIFNVKKGGRLKSIYSSIKKAKGDYVIVWSPSSVLEKDSIERLSKLIKYSNGADVIEFNAKLKTPFKTKGVVRKEYESKVLISENKDIIAYTYPFDFNKVFKKSLLSDVLKMENSLRIDSMFSIEHIYKALLLAKTYASFNETILAKTKNSEINNVNIIKIIKQWSYIRDFADYNFGTTYKNEIDYAQYYHLVVVVKSLVDKLNHATAKIKFKQHMKDLFSNGYSSFFQTNKYIISKTEEAKTLIKNKDADKLHKNLKELQKWM